MRFSKSKGNVGTHGIVEKLGTMKMLIAVGRLVYGTKYAMHILLHGSPTGEQYSCYVCTDFR